MKPRTISKPLSYADMKQYGSCEPYGEQNFLSKFSYWVMKLFQPKNGWGSVGVKYDPVWDKSEEEC